MQGVVPYIRDIHGPLSWFYAHSMHELDSIQLQVIAFTLHTFIWGAKLMKSSVMFTKYFDQ